MQSNRRPSGRLPICLANSWMDLGESRKRKTRIASLFSSSELAVESRTETTDANVGSCHSGLAAITSNSSELDWSWKWFILGRTAAGNAARGHIKRVMARVIQRHPLVQILFHDLWFVAQNSGASESASHECS